jgi:hypothetical protein
MKGGIKERTIWQFAATFAKDGRIDARLLPLSFCSLAKHAAPKKTRRVNPQNSRPNRLFRSAL